MRQNKKVMHRKYPTANRRPVKKLDQIELLIHKVCEVYKIDPRVLMHDLDSRKRPLPEIRFMVMTLAKTRLKMSYREAGAIFDKDHATAMHAAKTIKNLREIDKKFKQFTNQIFYS
jgi:chromosomal replication initiator protein